MSILPAVSHANKGTPCWKSSGEITDVQEAISLYRMAFEPTTLTPTSSNGVFGSISGNSVFNNATIVGWAFMNPYALGSAYIINIYLTRNENGTPDGFGNVFTGITVSSTAPRINLAGLQYADYMGIENLYLGYTITSNGTANNTITCMPYSGGTCPYASQFSYAAWIVNPAVPVVVICE